MEAFLFDLPPGLKLLLAVIGLVLTALTPVLVALVQRGGKSSPVEVDTALVMPTAQYDRLLDQYADLDDRFDSARKRIDSLERENRDLYRRALRAEIENDVKDAHDQ